MLQAIKRFLSKPVSPEQTGRQARPLPQYGRGLGQGFWGVGSIPRGSYHTYRMMRCDPTLAMAKAAAFAPIKAAGHSWEAEDDAPPGAVELLQKTVDPIYKALVKDILLAVEYGFFGAELVWSNDAVGRFVLAKHKPLLNDLTQILIEPEHGNYAGLRNQGIDLDPDNALLFSHDAEAGDLYGRSRYENIRLYVWSRWVKLQEKWDQYVHKATGIIPMIEYPTGQSYDSSGALVDNFQTASALLTTLGSGQGVAMPREFAPWAEAMIAKGQVDPATISNWAIRFVEVAPGHGAEILDGMKYLDTLKCRGFLTPERTILEGQHGTLAEAESHTDVALSVADDLLGEIVACINKQVVDPMLRYNWGPSAVGKVRLCPAPIVDDERAFVRQLLSAVLGNPANTDLLMYLIDMDAAIDEAGLPKAKPTLGPLPIPAPSGNPGAIPPKPPTPGPLSAAIRRFKSNGRLNRLFT